MTRERRDTGPLRVVIAGGGTGGHVYPALAVGEEIRRADPSAEVLFLGTARGLESRVVPARGFAFHLIAARGFPRRLSWDAVVRLATIAKGAAATLAFLARLRPHVVLGTGGYVSAPAVLAGALLRRPVVVQEQNAIPGVANRALSRLAREIHVAFPEARAWFGGRAERVVLSGNPLRQEILAGDRARARARWDFDPARPVVLIFGGSLGARSLNGAVAEAAPLLARAAEPRAQLLVQTGEAMHAQVEAACRAAGLNARVLAYIEAMGDAYAVADFVVCRAGALTLAEVCAAGLPSVLVPYPHAAHRHQDANAASLVAAGAARVIADAALTGETLAAAVRDLACDPALRRAMGERARSLARPSAAADVARSLYRVAGRPLPAALAEQTPGSGAGGREREGDAEADATRGSVDGPRDGRRSGGADASGGPR